MMIIDKNLSAFAYAHGGPALTGTLKAEPSNFMVDEDLGFELAGTGEHVCLHIEKTNCNTTWLADQIAKLAKVKPFNVSFAGMKDRNAITRQWFSVYLPKRPEIDWQQLENDDIKLIEITQHNKKLRRGSLKQNHFKLVLRDIDGDRDRAETLFKTIQQNGLPNFVGPQRFGIDGSNLQSAELLFQGKIKPSRNKRSIYLSAVRSWLFNCVLDERVKQNLWNKALQGDAMMLVGSNSTFICETIDDAINQRIEAFDISPTGPLFGEGKSSVTNDALALENAVLADYEPFTAGLINAGLEQDRRSLRFRPSNLAWSYEGKDLLLSFTLPKGVYATSMLREVIRIIE
ncbi:MAG: tRNA pseudouridine(13) synthase TruD [Legionellales bacterium]|nr:tRNA pseudouridine(13) synthase TruD [Legionellales bacterium]|tara:strand:+ start:16712 stop:17746 length:1035 start_codon:yes stop_codon:yes gene_type:complete